jgi:hypothetical protein
MWAERIDKKFRDRAPHMVKGLHGREGEFFVCENISPIPVAAAFGRGSLQSSYRNITKRVLRRPRPVYGTQARGLKTRIWMVCRPR